eukprot:360643-Chlamydomonas_euryale.AAC.4
MIVGMRCVRNLESAVGLRTGTCSIVLFARMSLAARGLELTATAARLNVCMLASPSMFSL